ncbi:MAG: hypothetical protein F4X84_01910 [Synechococcus sp. SB0662_bin_45]|nr:hypothetical protein [Synechococcus sp. SB0668_bin_13]MYE21151.1 hypothetical protein [Synechococcus sp. SB0662_bin_45]
MTSGFRADGGKDLLQDGRGALAVGDPIVLVATAGDGCGQALASCQAILERLKHHAPSGKKSWATQGNAGFPATRPTAAGSRQPE